MLGGLSWDWLPGVLGWVGASPRAPPLGVLPALVQGRRRAAEGDAELGIAMATRGGKGGFPWQEQLGGSVALGEVMNEPCEGEGFRHGALPCSRRSRGSPSLPVKVLMGTTGV